MVLARPDEGETCPYHFNLHLFTMVRRSSCGPITRKSILSFLPFLFVPLRFLPSLFHLIVTWCFTESDVYLRFGKPRFSWIIMSFAADRTINIENESINPSWLPRGTACFWRSSWVRVERCRDRNVNTLGQRTNKPFYSALGVELCENDYFANLDQYFGCTPLHASFKKNNNCI